jgi:hypothetical protein
MRSFVVALTLIGIVGLVVPAAWMAPVTGVLAGLLGIPVAPLGDMGTRLGRWLRPPRDPVAAQPEMVQHLLEELEVARQVAHERQWRIEELQEQIRELERARRSHRGEAAVETLYARNTGRGTGRGDGLLRLSVGRNHGVTAGAVAVFRGVHLVGRVAPDPGALCCWLIPITDPAAGLLAVSILPPDAPDGQIASAPRVQLSPDGRGNLVGEIDRNARIRPGDVAELFDPVWPTGAAGMKIGAVQEIVPREDDPLLCTVVVKPQYPAHRLPAVTLKIESVFPPDGVEPP